MCRGTCIKIRMKLLNSSSQDFNFMSDGHRAQSRDAAAAAVQSSAQAMQVQRRRLTSLAIERAVWHGGPVLVVIWAHAGGPRGKRGKNPSRSHSGFNGFISRVALGLIG